MIAAPLSGHQASKLPLVHLQGAPQGHISAPTEVPPHHEAVLQVWEDQPIIEREKETPPQEANPPQDPQELSHLGPNLLYVVRPAQTLIHPYP